MRVPLPLVPRPVRYAGVAAVAGALLVASIIDPPTGGGPPPYGPFGLVLLDKWVHALAYAALAGALLYALARADPRALVVAVALAAGYGLGIEAVQASLPERSFDLADAAANTTGAVVAAAGWRAVMRYVRLVPVPRG